MDKALKLVRYFVEMWNLLVYFILIWSWTLRYYDCNIDLHNKIIDITMQLKWEGVISGAFCYGTILWMCSRELCIYIYIVIDIVVIFIDHFGSNSMKIQQAK